MAFFTDFARATKHVGVAADQLDYATLVLCDPSGVPHMVGMRAQPFGPPRASANWARATSIAQFFLKEISFIWIGIYAEGRYSAEPASTSEPTSLAAK